MSKVIAATVLLVAIGVGSFFGVRALSDDGPRTPAPAEVSEEPLDIGESVADQPLTDEQAAPAVIGDPFGAEDTPVDAPVYTERGGASGTETLKRVTEGDWIPPARDPDAIRRGEEALKAADQKPVFKGEFNGFFFGFAERRNRPLHCDPSDTSSLSDSEAEQSTPLKLAYLPPNTWQLAAVTRICPDGLVNSAAFAFRIDRMETLNMAYFRSSRPLARIDVSIDRIEAGTINGRPAIIINPVTPEGYSDSEVVFTTSDGYVVVDAEDLPLEEVLKIAEGLTCEGC